MSKVEKEMQAQEEIREETGVAIVPADNTPAVTNVQNIFSGENIQVLTSIQGEDRETKIKIYNAMADQEANISDLANTGEVLEVTDYVAFPVTIEDEFTGEPINAVRVVLVTKDGKCYGSVATGVLSSMQKIMGAVGQAPWNPPIKLTPVEKKTRKGFKTLILRLVP